MRPFKLLDPRSLDEACQMLDRYGEDVKLISGGTAILILLRQRVFSKPYFINLKAVPGLDGIRDEPGTGLRIGALATLRAVETSPIVRQRAPLITETFRLVANVRVRNSGTLGGNLSHGDYRLDPPAPLLVLGAKAVAVSSRGRNTYELKEFFRGLFETALQPDEILTEVVVPDAPPKAGTAYFKYTSLSETDWPCLGVAALVTPSDGGGTCGELRVAVTSVAERPMLLEHLGPLARGKRLTERLLEELGDAAAERVDPIADARGSEWYKKEMVRVFVRRAVREAARRAGIAAG